MSGIDFSQRMLVARAVCGMCHMQVCVEAACTDDEILEFCNRTNPAGTSNGWTDVLRDDFEWMDKTLPGATPCTDRPDDRVHLLVSC